MLLLPLMPASCNSAGFPLTMKFRAASTQIISTAPSVSGLLPQEAPLTTAEGHKPFFCCLLSSSPPV